MEEHYEASDIQVLTFSEAVQKRPGLYFEDCFTEKSLDQLVIETTCHAVDEFIDGNCSKITLGIAEDHFTVTYDAGMPLDIHSPDENITLAEIMMTEIFACKNHKKHLSVGHDFCKYGIASINAASDWCEVETVSNHQLCKLKFVDGITVFRELQSTNEQAFTTIKLKPKSSLFNGIWFTLKGVEEKANQLSENLNGFMICVENLAAK